MSMGAGDSDGESLGAAQCEGLGHQFANHHVEVGDEGEAEGDGCDVGVEESVGLGEGQSADPAHESGGGQRLADPAQGQGAEGDAELDGGKKVVQIVLQAADGACSGDVGGEHLLDARVADGDQSELGGHKEGVGQNEHGHGDKLEQGKTVHPGVRIAFQWTVNSGQRSVVGQRWGGNWGTTNGWKAYCLEVGARAMLSRLPVRRRTGLFGIEHRESGPRPRTAMARLKPLGLA